MYYMWNFPITGLVIPPPSEGGGDYIERATGSYEYHEFWRFYQSGQFVHFSGMLPDWRDQCFARPVIYNNLSADHRVLGIGETILYFLLVFEFVSRLSMIEYWDEYTNVIFLFGNLEERTLWVDEINGFLLFGNHSTSKKLSEFKIFDGRKFSKQELASNSDNFALEAAEELFKRFNWDPPMTTLRSYLDRYRRG